MVVFRNLTGQLGQLALTETICLSDSVCCITYEPLLNPIQPNVTHMQAKPQGLHFYYFLF